MQCFDSCAFLTGRASVETDAFGFVEVGNAAFSSSVIVFRPELEDELDEGRAVEVDDVEVREEDEVGALSIEDEVRALAVTVDTSTEKEFSGWFPDVCCSTRNSKKPINVKNPTL